ERVTGDRERPLPKDRGSDETRGEEQQSRVCEPREPRDRGREEDGRGIREQTEVVERVAGAPRRRAALRARLELQPQRRGGQPSPCAPIVVLEHAPDRPVKRDSARLPTPCTGISPMAWASARRRPRTPPGIRAP